MADKAITDLNTIPGSVDDNNTWFAVAQSGTAYKVSGHEFTLALGTILDGHGGVKSIVYTPPTPPSLTGTMVVTLADNTTTTVNVENGKGITSIAKTSTAGLVDTYTITYNDSTTSSFTVSNGAKGDTGDSWYVWIRYAGSMPTSDADMGTTPDDWIGIYSGTEDDPSNLHYTDYDWFEYKGEKGDTGTASAITTQTIGYQASNSGTVVPSGSWTTTIPTVPPGSFLWTRTQLAFNDGSVVTAYSVSRFGIDGTGAVSTVNSISPDGNGNVALTADDIPLTNNVSVEDTIDQIETDVGDVSNLTTAATNCVDAINEVKTSIDNKGDNWLAGKTVHVFGDSLSVIENNPWSYIEQLAPSATIYNHAINGSDFATVASTIASTTLSNADVIFILCGTNDWQGGTALNTTETNIESCLTNIYTKIKTAQIVLITPPYSLMSTTEEKNSLGYKISAYCEAIKYKANKYNLPCVDLFHTSACNITTVTTMMDDSGSGKRVHPNAYLAKNMAECIISLATSDKHELVPVPLTRNSNLLPSGTYIAEYDPRSKCLWIPNMQFSGNATMGTHVFDFTNLDLLGITALSTTAVDATGNSPTHYLFMLYIPPEGGSINAWTGDVNGRTVYSPPLILR